MRRTIGTAASSRVSRFNLRMPKFTRYRGQFLWEGRLRSITIAFMMTPWNMWFQTTVLLTVIYKFTIHMLVGYYLDNSYAFLDATIALTEIFYFIDVTVHLLHAFWPIVRLQIRVYRRNYFFLAYDVISLFPLTFILYHSNIHGYAKYGRWLGICRIYRLYTFFHGVNESVRTSRKTLYVIEHAVSAILVLHASTCCWFTLHNNHDASSKWYDLGYPSHVNSWKLKFDNYVSCWYYCSCRLFNVIFGDVFPIRDAEKWMTSLLMLVGYVFARYQFIGLLTWELVLKYTRISTFVDRYHHMITYLKFRGAPPWLLEQATSYKKKLWRMKDGILYSDHLQKLPLPLQMELIFDVNVGHFHSSLIFRDTDESFMRQISLLMRHELYLAGQHIWSQGVVKNGMLFVKRGVIEMLSDEDDESPVIAFKKGTVLGEISLFHSIPSKVTVKAATYVEVQVLRRTDFMRVISEHPNMLQHIRGKITNRLRTTRKKQVFSNKNTVFKLG